MAGSGQFEVGVPPPPGLQSPKSWAAVLQAIYLCFTSTWVYVSFIYVSYCHLFRCLIAVDDCINLFFRKLEPEGN